MTDEPIPERDYIVRIVDMETKIHGLVSEDEDGFCTIFINAKQPDALQIRAYRHELRHIYRQDFAKKEAMA